MNEINLNPTPEALVKARVEANRLARLLSEELPDGDELKDVWYEVNRTIRPALVAIRELEGKVIVEASSCDIG